MSAVVQLASPLAPPSSAAPTSLRTSVHSSPPSSASYSLTPKEVYGPADAPCVLSWANGGAGPTGVLKVLAEALLQEELPDTRVEWYMNISRLGLELVAKGEVDVALTYERDQEDAYIERGELVRLGTMFNDHFILVGPASYDGSPGISQHAKVLATIAGDPRAIFVSRDDGSATNCKELECWDDAGLLSDLAAWRQTGFDESKRSKALAMRYERHQVFPEDALLLANKLNAFTLTDHGTWSKVSSYGGASDLRVIARGGSRLLNPCQALVRPDSLVHPTIQALQRFMASTSLTATIEAFRPNDVQLFTPPGQPDFEY